MPATGYWLALEMLHTLQLEYVQENRYNVEKATSRG